MTRRARIVVPGDPSAVAFARARVITHVRTWGVPLDEELRESVKLVASELITNAVVHGGGFATVGLYYADGRLLLVVHDGNADEPRRECATGDDEAGRGLALVELLAARNGWEPTANGKKVWAEFDVPTEALRPLPTQFPASPPRKVNNDDDYRRSTLGAHPYEALPGLHRSPVRRDRP
ncbi:ATP-binding protein [Streptomyces sp. NBC_01481]|uniref:ATP-binding protein n=1 Tax=Streptomyces sp. NBC_01481 TaxID=2975869 RepID=UPI002253A1CC|nr:ATP-binding protein [Streptomyces sp. NBC_01481]MCX4587166.1 ATP-binding protein [Streptomyces sp. NBC_01481]